MSLVLPKNEQITLKIISWVCFVHFLGLHNLLSRFTDFSIRGYLFWQFVFSCDILSQASSYSKETLVFHNGDIFTWAECSEQQHEVGRRWLLLLQWGEIISGGTYWENAVVNYRCIGNKEFWRNSKDIFTPLHLVVNYSI